MLVDEAEAVSDQRAPERLSAKALAEGIGPNFAQGSGRRERCPRDMSWISPDSQDMLGATAGLADQLEASALMAREVGGLPSPEGLESIVVLGMSGSGVAGEILQAIGKDQLSLPVALVGDYSLPSFVGPSSLVIAVSFSGQTEETLEPPGPLLKEAPGYSR